MKTFDLVMTGIGPALIGTIAAAYFCFWMGEDIRFLDGELMGMFLGAYLVARGNMNTKQTKGTKND